MTARPLQQQRLRSEGEASSRVLLLLMRLRAAVDRLALPHLVAGERAGLRGRQLAAFELRHELLLARHQALAQTLEIETGGARLREQALRGLLFFLDVMLDVLGQDLD